MAIRGNISSPKPLLNLTTLLTSRPPAPADIPVIIAVQAGEVKPSRLETDILFTSKIRSQIIYNPLVVTPTMLGHLVKHVSCDLVVQSYFSSRNQCTHKADSFLIAKSLHF